MAVILTLTATVTSWRALQRLNREALLGQARQAGATRYRVYRNAMDASQVLVIAEFPDHESVQEMSRGAGEHAGAVLAAGAWDDRVWEATAFEAIE